MRVGDVRQGRFAALKEDAVGASVIAEAPEPKENGNSEALNSDKSA